MDDFTKHLTHLVNLARTNRAWAEYAWWRAKQMAQEHPMYARMPEALTEAMQSRASTARTESGGA